MNKQKMNVNLPDRVCPVCGKTFRPTRACNLYCSLRCRDDNFNARRREATARRKPRVVACRQCGKEFSPKTSKGRFCSQHCACKFWREHNPDIVKANKARNSAKARETARKRYRVNAEIKRLAEAKVAREREEKRKAAHRAKLWADIHKPIRDDEPLGRWL